MISTQLKRETLKSHLPPAACTEEMLKKLREIADEKQTSVSSVMRYAIALFLEGENRKPSDKIEKLDIQPVIEVTP